MRKPDEGIGEGKSIAKETLLGKMMGGGEIGMRLEVRMRYKGQVIDPTVFIV